MSETFLENNRVYHFRVRARKGGVWGPWSPLFSFKVLNPERPFNIQADRSERGKLTLTWKGVGGKGVEYLLFGSNRLDFVPEIYADRELTSALNWKVTGRRVNRNLIAETGEKKIRIAHRHHFYRIVAKKGDAWSTPSDLIRIPLGSRRGSSASSPQRVLQTRHTRVSDDSARFRVREEYRARETELPER